MGLDTGYCESWPRDIGISGYGIFEGGQWWESGCGMVVSEERAHGSDGVGIGSCVRCCRYGTGLVGPCWNWAQIEVSCGVSDTGHEVCPIVGGDVYLVGSKIHSTTSLTEFWDRNEG